MAYQPEIEKLEQRYQADPARNFAQLAEAYRREGRLDEALDLLRLHLEERPSYVSGLIVLGRCLLDQQSDAEARDTFERVLAVDAEHIIALKSLADIAERSGDVPEARNWLQRLLDVDPMNDEAQEALERLATVEASPVAAAPATDAVEEPAVHVPAPEELAEGAPPADLTSVAEHREAEPLEATAAPADAEGPTPTVIEMAAVSPESPPAEADDAAAAVEPEPAPDEEVPADDSLVIERASAEYQGIPADLEPVQLERAEEADLPPAPQADTEPAASDAEADRPMALDEEPTEEIVAPDLGLSLDAPRAPEGEAAAAEPPPSDMPMQPFDTELGWGTGERTSRQISPEDLAEAAQAHDDAVEKAAAQELPGLESADVPDLDVHVDAADGLQPAGAEGPAEPVEPVAGLTTGGIDESLVPTAPVEGLEPTTEPVPEAPFPPEAPEEQDMPAPPEPVLGGDTVLEQPAITDLGVDEAAAPPAPEPEPQPEPILAVDHAPEAEEPDEDDDDSLAGLPVFLPEERAAGEDGAPIVTETMAEVYARQGLIAEAQDIYRELLRHRPDDARLRARLAELEEKPAAAEVARDRPTSYAASATGGESARALLKRVLARASGGYPEDEPAVAPAPEPVARPPDTPLDEAFGVEDAEGDETESVSAEQAPESPRGAPTAPAVDEVSLASVFGDAPPPKAPEPSAPRGPDAREPTGGFSFDEFFGQKGERPSAETRKPRDTLADDEGDEAFKNWLKGLKS